MNKLLIACMSAAFALSVNAAPWFNGGLSSAGATGGTWTGATGEEAISLTPESGEVSFAATATKSLDTDVVTITSEVALTEYDSVEDLVAGDAKAALAPVDGKYYGLVSGTFVELSGAEPTDDPVTVTIQMRKVLGRTQVKYSVDGTALADKDGNTWIYTTITEAPTEVAYSGTGTVSSLAGATDTPEYLTAANPTISDAAGLAAVAKTAADFNGLAGQTVTLGADIALTGTVTPIGAGNNKDNRSAATFGDTAFKGVFDGDNHTISGVILPCQDYVGLFGSTLGATIKNLKVSLGNATGFDGVTTGDGRTEEYSGAPIVGCALNTTIENCETVATEGAVFTAAKAAAGIVGYAGSGTTVKDCTNNLPIKSTTNAKAAGIVGCAQDATGDHLNGGVGLTIDGCSNTGTVTGKSGGNGSGLVTYTDNAVTFKGANSTIAGDVVSVIYLNSGSITLEEGATFTVPADKKTVNKNAVDGLQLATVSEGVATLVKAADVTVGGSYKVMAAGATITLANVGDSITLDEALATADVTTTAENAKVTKSGNTYTVEQDLATVGFQVIIAENANVEATVKIDGETVETVPSTLTEGQTYAVTFAPVEGFMFETAPTPVSGMVGTTDITVNAPSAVKIVAKAGEVPCASLQAALTLGGTVTLAADTTVAEWQIVDKAVTLDLGGHTLSAAETFTSDQDAVLAVKHGGSLTVKNGTIDGESVLCGIKLSQNAADVVDPYTDENKAVVVVDGATVIGREYGISGNGKAGRGNTAVTVKSGTVKATAANGVGIYNPQTGTVLVEGGTVEAPAFGVYAKSGTVTIEGGVVKATATEAVNPSVNNNGTSGQGYAVVLEKGTASGGYANGLEASITGGTFESVGAPVLSWTRNAETAPALAGLITAGKFKGGEMDVALIAAVEGKEASWTTDAEGNLVPEWTDIPTLAAAKYSETFNGSRGNPSTKVGGTAFTYATWDWPAEQTYTAVRGDETDKALVLADNCTPGNNANATAGGSISFLTVAKMANSTTAPKVIACVSGNANNNDSTGMLLVYQDRKVKLVNYKRTTDGVDVLAEYTDENIEKQFHSYLVTFNKDTMEAALFVDGKIQGSVKTARFVPGQMYQIGSIIGAVGNVSVDGVACQKGAGIAIDEFALWDEDISAFAQDVADKYAVWPQIRMVYTNAKAEDNWDTLDEYEYTLADGTPVTDVTLADTIVLTSDAVLGVNKSFNGIKLQVGDATHNVTVRFAQAGESWRQEATLANAEITVAAGSKVELNQHWKNNWSANLTPKLVNTTIEGAGLVEIASDMTLVLDNSTISAKLTGSGTTPAFTGMTLDSTWAGTVKVPAKTGSEAQNFDVNAYGTVNSTVELAGIAPVTGQDTYPPKTNTTESPKVVLTGDVEFNNGYGDYTTTWSELSGTGNFTVSKARAAAQKYAFTKIANYTGAIKAGDNAEITIGSIVIAEVPETTITPVKFGADCVLNNVKIDDMKVVLANGKDVTDEVTVEKTAAGITVVKEAAQDWPVNPTEVEGKTAAEAFGESIPEALADVAADKLAIWAKGTGAVDFADKASINADAFMLNMANASTAKQIADEVESNITQELVDALAAGDTTTVLAAIAEKYPNATVELVPVTELPDAADGSAAFRRLKISLK